MGSGSYIPRFKSHSPVRYFTFMIQEACIYFYLGRYDSGRTFESFRRARLESSANISEQLIVLIRGRSFVYMRSAIFVYLVVFGDGDRPSRIIFL